MPATNGELHPNTSDHPALATPGKRKRGSGQEEESAQKAGSSVADSSQEKEELQENLQNIVEILSKCALPNKILDLRAGVM